MRNVFRTDIKETLIQLSKNEKRHKKFYIILFLEAILGFVLFPFTKVGFLIFGVVYVLGYIFEQLLEIWGKQDEKILRNNRLTDILMSESKFVSTLIFWAIEFPLLYTIINAVTYATYQTIGLSAVFLLDEISGGDWLVLVIFLLVLVVNREIGERVSESYQKRLRE